MGPPVMGYSAGLRAPALCREEALSVKTPYRRPGYRTIGRAFGGRMKGEDGWYSVYNND